MSLQIDGCGKTTKQCACVCVFATHGTSSNIKHLHLRILDKKKVD